MTRRPLRSRALPLAGLAPSAVAGNQVPFSDADWSLTNYGNTNATATQNVNGFSGSCRRVVHPLSGLAAIRAFHKYLPASATLDRANGEVVSIDFSIKAIFINGVGIVGRNIGRHQRRRHRRRFRLRHLRRRVRRAQLPLTPWTNCKPHH